MNKRDCVFVSELQLRRYPNAKERLQTLPTCIEFASTGRGIWIKRGSTAHSLAVLLGIEPYDYNLEESGKWDRNGRIA